MKRLVPVLLLVAAACGQASDPTTTSTAVAADATTTTVTSTTVATTTTSSTSSTTTAAAVDTGIAIAGSDTFAAHTEQALERIADTSWNEQVHAHIDIIESVESGSGMEVETKTFFVGEETAYAPGFSDAEQIVWFAGTIVHDSCHSRLYAEGRPHAGRDAELECLADQHAALVEIGASDYFVGYVQGLIDGVDDPANQYWTDPNRHW